MSVDVLSDAPTAHLEANLQENWLELNGGAVPTGIYVRASSSDFSEPDGRWDWPGGRVDSGDYFVSISA